MQNKFRTIDKSEQASIWGDERFCQCLLCALCGH